jgi:starvation-inducible DNA-binding protein
MKVNYGLSDSAIDTLATELGKLLADTHILYVKTLNCHWNLEDPRFLFLHQMFQTQYEALAEATDLLAERIRMMGRVAPGSLRAFVKLGSQEELDKVISGDEMIDLLAKGHEAAISEMRRVIAIGEKLGDPGTVDLLVDLVRDHEKTAWFLRSHL